MTNPVSSRDASRIANVWQGAEAPAPSRASSSHGERSTTAPSARERASELQATTQLDVDGAHSATGMLDRLQQLSALTVVLLEAKREATGAASDALGAAATLQRQRECAQRFAEVLLAAHGDARSSSVHGASDVATTLSVIG